MKAVEVDVRTPQQKALQTRRNNEHRRDRRRRQRRARYIRGLSFDEKLAMFETAMTPAMIECHLRCDMLDEESIAALENVLDWLRESIDLYASE
jgi:hypothetical protein